MIDLPQFCTLKDAGIDRSLFARALLQAEGVRGYAYAPYSKFQVGAAVICADGKIYAGCNVETANFDGTHAEGAALAVMASSGRRDPVACICVGGQEGEAARIIMPCGKCRQALEEFRSLNARQIWIGADPFDGQREPEERYLLRLTDLLPNAFGPASLGIDLAKYRR